MLRISLVGVGRLKAGLERDLASRYVARAAAASRPLGITIETREIDESRARRAADRMREEAAALRAVMSQGTEVLALDETGTALDSSGLAELVAAARDAGCSSLAVVIGGADGLDPDFRRGTRHVVAFGAMTWPHQLVRVMAAEQIYRVVTILAGHPYHRG